MANQPAITIADLAAQVRGRATEAATRFDAAEEAIGRTLFGPSPSPTEATDKSPGGSIEADLVEATRVLHILIERLERFHRTITERVQANGAPLADAGYPTTRIGAATR